MDTQQIDKILRQTYEDHRLSRSERRALTELFSDYPDHDTLAQIRARAFRIARDAFTEAAHYQTLDWLEDVTRVLHATERGHAPRTSSRSEVAFSPGDAPRLKIAALFQQARKAADVCVFTITDDRIADSILSAHRRGVTVRIITDDDKAHDLGSDVKRLAKAGIPVRPDRSDAHMHHKFAIFDSAVLLTGSYNWTRAACRENEENVLLTDTRSLVDPFVSEFERLWNSLA